MADHYTFSYPALRPAPTLRSGKAEWLQCWLDGQTPDPAIWEQQGFQLNAYYAVVIYQPHADSSTSVASLLQQEASRRGIFGPIVAYNSSAVLFHPVEDPQQTTRLKRKTEEIREQLAARLHDSQLCCGVGRPARGTDNLRQSFSEALDAVRISKNLPSQSTFFGNSSLYHLLLSLKNPAELERFCTTWLSDLIRYDEDQHSELIATMRAYFANNGNTALTAKELRIHRNTLAYRLNRIAEITCLDLDDADVRLNLHLALKAGEVLGLLDFATS